MLWLYENDSILQDAFSSFTKTIYKPNQNNEDHRTCGGLKPASSKIKERP